MKGCGIEFSHALNHSCCSVSAKFEQRWAVNALQRPFEPLRYELQRFPGQVIRCTGQPDPSDCSLPESEPFRYHHSQASKDGCGDSGPARGVLNDALDE